MLNGKYRGSPDAKYFHMARLFNIQHLTSNIILNVFAMARSLFRQAQKHHLPFAVLFYSRR
jgi:hypothetical protein